MYLSPRHRGSAASIILPGDRLRSPGIVFNIVREKQCVLCIRQRRAAALRVGKMCAAQRSGWAMLRLAGAPHGRSDTGRIP